MLTMYGATTAKQQIKTSVMACELKTIAAASWPSFSCSAEYCMTMDGTGITHSAAMTPRASAKLCGMNNVHTAADSNPRPYFTPINLATACTCIRSIAGLKRTPSVSNTIGLFAFASGTTSCEAV